MRENPDRLTTHQRSFPVGYGVAVLVAMACALPWLWIGAKGALDSNSNDPRQWLPRGFDETKKYRWFQEHFGRDEIAVVSWPACTLDNPKIDEFADALVGPPAAAGDKDSPYLFQRALTGRRTLRQLTSPPLSLSEAEALRRLRGILVGPDDRTTCVVLVVSKLGEADRTAAVQEIRRVAREEFGVSQAELRLGGPTVDAATIDEESQRLVLELAGISGIVAFLVTWLQLKSLRLAVLVLAGALYSTAGALSLLYYSGGTMNLVLTMLSPLVYVLSISAGVHLVNYYRDAVREEGPAGASVRAVAHGWVPCVLSAVTTAVGLASLSSSEVVPVMKFGIYSAAGMLISVTVLFLFLPPALHFWPLRPSRGGGATHGSRSPGKTSGAIDFVTSAICRHHAVIACASIALMVAMGWGLWYLKSTVKLQHRFAPDSKIIADYQWLEKHLGPLVPMEVVIRFAPSCRLGFLERLELVSFIQRQIAAMDEVGATMSAADFAPPLVDSSADKLSAREVARRHALMRVLPKSRQRIIRAHFLAEDPEEELWRVSVRLKALSDVDYGHFTEALKEHVDPLLLEWNCGLRTVDAELSPPESTIHNPQSTIHNPHVRATYTGVIPLIYKAQRELFNDLFESFLYAFCFISLMMVAVLRSLRAGLLSMAPNVFPALVVFGFMGWSGLLVEIGSVMTASAALGIAVDDTFHFLTWFRRGDRAGMSRHDALRFAYQHCARAMINTTVICGSGLLVFSLSTFMPIVHFAWLMATLLAAALVGDLIFLPALLAGPLGRVFQKRPGT